MRIALALIVAVSGCSPAVYQSDVAVAPGKVQNAEALKGEAGFKTAMAAFDYKRAFEIAEQWRKDEPQAAAPAIAFATASNALADIATSDADTDAFVQKSLDALAPHRTKPSEAASAPAQAGVVAFLVAEALALRARTKGTGALSIIPEVAENGEMALKLAPTYEDGAPGRLLGMVLSKAPPWPHGPGDPDRGFKLLQEAAEKYPQRPEPYVHLADVLLDQSRVQDAGRNMQRARTLIGKNPRAKRLYLDVEARMKTNKNVKRYD